MKNKRKTRKTVGRGGKNGTYSGRGVKGQKARSGVSIDPLFEGGRSTLIDHMKKKRGFKAVKPAKIAIKYSDLVKKFENGAKITVDDLAKKNFLKKTEKKHGVKILGPSDGKTKFTFEEKISLSKSVK